ncbi:unnamed protein product [Sphagnum jensenii]|uniref:Golgi apparatus membrane protein TVP23 n=1 Tax=Sphagnum jensenii TaxID=128206 RepID=A0ABP1B094_9BRYO
MESLIVEVIGPRNGSCIAYNPDDVEEILGKVLKMAEDKYANPITVFFHTCFKVAAVAAYLIGGFFSASYVINFVVTITLLGIDFWIVKNVSGRILVGLRWWNEINEKGGSIWRFESLDQQSLQQLNKNEAWLFWWSLYINAGVWIALGIVALIKFNLDYMLIVIVAIVLNSANTAGYTKCQKDAEKKARSGIQAITTGIFQSAFRAVASTV